MDGARLHNKPFDYIIRRMTVMANERYIMVRHHRSSLSSWSLRALWIAGRF